VDDDATPDHAAYCDPVEFKEILKRRRMVRAYEPEPIPRDAVERIVGTVLRAPSGGFSQGHRLLVVTEAETRARLAELFDEETSVAEGREPWISAAPVLVVVGTREESYHERYRRPDKVQSGREIEWPVPYWHVDAGAAMMLLLLAAIDEGYAAGVFGVPVELQPAFKELLGIPEDVAVVACVTIGHPADDSSWSAVSSRLTQARKPIGELVRWERWD
jgi:FMN reductase [NAD(P)H]